MRIRLAVPAAVFMAALGLSVTLASRADGSAEAGAAKAALCLACHGPNGNSSTAAWPNLAGQNGNYIIEQLKLFKNGKRTDPLMSPIAATLTEQDMADVAAYYRAQTPAGLESDPSYWKEGEKLYRSGNPAKSVPACIACHGPAGRGNEPARYPALRAQHAVYTQKQLNDYVSGARTGAQAEVMRTIAQRLTAEDIRNVASYIQGMR